MRRFIIASLFVLGCSSSEEGTTETVTDTGTTVEDTSTTTTDSSTTTDTTTATDTTSSETTPSETSPADTTTTSDTPAADTGKADTGKPPLDGGGCSDASDCRLFSSYCSTAACVCIPLLKGEPSPKCEGGMVSCFVDPCSMKTAACEGGKCVAK
jgi:hypothetical protein